MQTTIKQSNNKIFFRSLLAISVCQECASHLAKDMRVKDPVIFGNRLLGTSQSLTEYYIAFDSRVLSSYQLSKQNAYATLQQELLQQTVGSLYQNGVATPIHLVSAHKETFDAWHLANKAVPMGNRKMLLSSLGQLTKRNSGIDIYKENRQYTLYVAFYYVGTEAQSQRVIEQEMERLQKTVLPLGYKIQNGSGTHQTDKENRIWVGLLLIIAAIIYFVCAILFESLVYPLLIISLIPISIIGVFLTFALTGYNFDQGGLASLVMLSGLVVNAGIYLLSEYQIQVRRNKPNPYLRAFNHKIVPIFLTVLSSVLGLIPFLFDGPQEVFWFAFALGTMGGMLFSLFALLFFMPIWLPANRPSQVFPFSK